jgi:hypothetical protein
VLEEMPIQDEVDDRGGAFDDIHVIDSLLSNRQSNHIPVLIDLKISDEDVQRRMLSVWMDPLTGKVYTEDRMKHSRAFYKRMLHQKKTEERDLDVLSDTYSDQSDDYLETIIEPNRYEYEVSDIPLKQALSSEEDIENEIDEEDMKEREAKEKKRKLLSELVSGQMKPKLIREDILERCVRLFCYAVLRHFRLGL